MTTLSSKRHPYNQWSPDARALDRVGDKWTLLIIRDLADGPRRFVDLQRTLPGISTEQLRSRLNRMVDDELLTRSRYRARCRHASTTNSPRRLARCCPRSPPSHAGATSTRGARRSP